MDYIYIINGVTFVFKNCISCFEQMLSLSHPEDRNIYLNYDSTYIKYLVKILQFEEKEIAVYYSTAINDMMMMDMKQYLKIMFDISIILKKIEKELVIDPEDFSSGPEIDEKYIYVRDNVFIFIDDELTIDTMYIDSSNMEKICLPSKINNMIIINYNEDLFYTNSTNKITIKGYKISLKNLPNTKELIINYTYMVNASLDDLPIDLEILRINSYGFNCSINCLSNKVKELYINSNSFNLPLDGITNGLKILKIDSPSFDKTLNDLPDSIEEIYINNVKRPLNKLPSNLKKLTLDEFNKPLKIPFPNGLQELSLPSFNHKINIGILPKSLTKLILPYNFPKENIDKMYFIDKKYKLLNIHSDGYY